MRTAEDGGYEIVDLKTVNGVTSGRVVGPCPTCKSGRVQMRIENCCVIRGASGDELREFFDAGARAAISAAMEQVPTIYPATLYGIRTIDITKLPGRPE